MERKLSGLYEFGPFRLDADERLLLRGGETVALPPKTFDLLLALVGQPGHLLEKETLLKTVWPDSFVEENNLADNISKLRKALGEGENGQKFIETVPKRGYRFVADVRELNGAAAKPKIPESATVVGTIETLTKAPALSSQFSRGRRSFLALSVPTFLVLVLSGAGLWLYFGQEKNTEVSQLEFKGNFYISRWTEDEIRKGIEYYTRAVALAPHSASAHDGLAVGWMFLSDLHLSPREAMPKAKAAATRALQLDETSAPAHVTMGVILMQYEWDQAGAEQEFRRAIALDPKYNPAHRLYGWHLIAAGRFDEAKAELTRALETDPLDDWGQMELGLSFYFARQYDQAIEQCRRAIGIEPKSYWSHMLLGWADEQEGRFSEAIAELNQARRLNDIPQVLASIGHAYAVSGQRAEAQKVIAELQESASRKYVSPYDLATIYAGLGEKEQAFAWLEKAYEDRSGWLALWLKVDPKFDVLHSDPRFHDLLRRVGLAP